MVHFRCTVRSSVVRAVGLYPTGRRFESYRTDHFDFFGGDLRERTQTSLSATRLGLAAWRQMVSYLISWLAAVITYGIFNLILVAMIPVGYLNTRFQSESVWWHILARAFKIYLYLAGVTLDINGQDNLPVGSRPIILAVNQLTGLDGLIVNLVINQRRPIVQLVTRSFVPWPLSFWLRKSGLTYRFRLQESQRSLMFFPEEKILVAKMNAVQLAISHDLELVPVTLYSRQNQGKQLLRPGQIKVVIQRPVSLPAETAAVKDAKLVEVLTYQLLCQIASKLPGDSYSLEMINATHKMLLLHPVTRLAVKGK